MPLIHSKSRKAMSENIKTEMEHGKPQPQAIAIAYSVKRKAKKKMAKGGMTYRNDSAASEQRPSTQERDNDSSMVSRNSNDAPPRRGDDAKTGEDISMQAKRGMRTTRIKHPRMVPTDSFSSRLRDEEDDLQISADTNDGPQHQPPEHDNEEGADRQGPEVHDMEREHSNHREPYAQGGEVNEHMEMMDQPEPEEEQEHDSSIAAAIMRKRRMAHGGEIHSHGSMDSDDSDMADLSRNADEDANEEDQASFDALRKENYSETPGLSQLNQPHESNEHNDPREEHEENIHDRSTVGMIRAKMRKKSPITR